MGRRVAGQPAMTPKRCEFLVVGAGITGLTIARELLARGAGDILVLDKEPALGVHASGRNSGVLHAGIYYTPDSLKARFCAEGNRLMKEFCRSRGLTLAETGKVVVARDASEIEQLAELKARAGAAGARAELIDAARLEQLEPHARTHEVALHSPDTAVVKPREILDAVARELRESGRCRIELGVRFVEALAPDVVQTSAGPVRFERLVNCAGAFADRIAHGFGLAREYRLIPFKGTYRKLVPARAHLVRGSVYPVPDLGNPFLGVHLTRGADGDVYAGPTALPAFGREAYRGLRGVGREAPVIAARDVLLLGRNRDFRRAARSETRKYSGKVVYREAAALVPELRPDDLQRTEKVGIRPQLVHWPTRRLVMDFVVVSDERGFHVLNAVSPAFTSSMAFAREVAGSLLGQQPDEGAGFHARAAGEVSDRP
ncbi:MAG TPA: L-2-hydroxyglutarate oxidase [Actinomycetota bacterium]|nr:L-2-hydroxyglutarate oxidase [Actinomycetota bacterium]